MGFLARISLTRYLLVGGFAVLLVGPLCQYDVRHLPLTN
jgi:hypothetical protein